MASEVPPHPVTAGKLPGWGSTAVVAMTVSTGLTALSTSREPAGDRWESGR